METNFESLRISLFRIFFSFFLFFTFILLFFFFFFSFFSRREAIKIAWPWVKRHAAEFRSEPDLIRVAITNAVIANSAWKRASTRSVRYFLIVRLINEQKIADVYGEGPKWRIMRMAAIFALKNSMPPSAIRFRDLLFPIIGTICRARIVFRLNVSLPIRRYI